MPALPRRRCLARPATLPSGMTCGPQRTTPSTSPRQLQLGSSCPGSQSALPAPARNSRVCLSTTGPRRSRARSCPVGTRGATSISRGPPVSTRCSSHLRIEVPGERTTRARRLPRGNTGAPGKARRCRRLSAPASTCWSKSPTTRPRRPRERNRSPRRRLAQRAEARSSSGPANRPR